MRLRIVQRVLVALALAAPCVAVASCGSDSSSTDISRVHVVALGDSETSGQGDSTGSGWVGRYARMLETKRALKVDVSNLAKNGKTSAELLADVRTDRRTRAALKGAEIIVFGIGGADLNAGDDNFAAGKCHVEACYAPVLKSFARNFDAIVATVRKLRGTHKTVLRSITQPNVLTGAEDVIPGFLKPVATRVGVYEARTANRAICAAMTRHGGRCIDVLRAFNGPSGTANAYDTGLLNHEDCCYPNSRGQQLMAEMLLRTGLSPVR